MESLLSQRLRMGVPVSTTSPSPPMSSHDMSDWLEPSEEFPILFGLLTARANAQQKSKEKQHQMRRRILRLNSNASSSARILRMEPDSSSPDEFIQRSPVSSVPGSRSLWNGVSRSPKNKISRRRQELEDNENDAIPTSTTADDYDLIGTTANGESNDAEIAPPPKRSRLEECLMRRLEGTVEEGQGQDVSYPINYKRLGSSDHQIINPPKFGGNRVQETSITTNSEKPNSISIPTLNLRELLAVEVDKSRQPPSVVGMGADFWKAHQFRFEKRKYTRKCINPEPNANANINTKNYLAADVLNVIGATGSRLDEERPFQCNQCHLKFKRGYHLTRHLTIHWREERFFCPGCKTACFQRKDNLLAHMRKCCPPTAQNPTLKIYSRSSFKTNKKSPPAPAQDSADSWICLSKFMESTKATASEELSPSRSENLNMIGLELDMVEISEVSSEETLSGSSDSKKSRPDEETERFWSQSDNKNGLLPLPQPLTSKIGQNYFGVNLTASVPNNGDKYPCGDCNAVFQNWDRLMKHSTTAHVIIKPNPNYNMKNKNIDP